MTTKVSIVNEGPDDILVESINWPATQVPNDAKSLKAGQYAEFTVWDTRTLAIREIK